MIFTVLSKKIALPVKLMFKWYHAFMGQLSSPLILYVSNRADRFVSSWDETFIINSNVFHWLISLLPSQVLNTHISFNYLWSTNNFFSNSLHFPFFCVWTAFIISLISRQKKEHFLVSTFLSEWWQGIWTRECCFVFYCTWFCCLFVLFSLLLCGFVLKKKAPFSHNKMWTNYFLKNRLDCAVGKKVSQTHWVKRCIAINLVI